jgi:hypothetical protein
VKKNKKNKTGFARVPVGSLRPHPDLPPINPRLIEILGATMVGERRPDVRHVPVRNLAVRHDHIVPAIVKLFLAHPEPPRGLIPVVEVARRRYWPFDDNDYVLALQQTHPDLLIAVDVLMSYESSAPQTETT